MEIKKVESIGMTDDKFLALIESNVANISKAQEKLNQKQKSKLSGFLLNNEKVQKALLYEEKEGEEEARLKAETENLVSFNVENNKKDIKQQAIGVWNTILTTVRGWCRKCQKEKEEKEE